jgi:peroxiredoxin
MPRTTVVSLLCALLLVAVVLSACSSQAPTAPAMATATSADAATPQAAQATETPGSLPTATEPAAAPPPGQPITKGMVAPDFTVQDLEGNLHSLSDHRSKVVMLNFWSTTCGFCRSEIPHMNTVYAEYADQGFEILAVSLGEDPEYLGQFADENDMEFLVLADVEGVTVPLYAIQSIPASYFLDEQGVVQAIYVGAIQEETLRTIVKTLLAR